MEQRAMSALSGISGVIVVDKPEGMTSHDVVNRLRRAYGTRQVGHTGTLDPMATGVLPVMVGRAVKAGEYLLSEDKSYEALLCLGVQTDTEDLTGTVLERRPVSCSEREVDDAAQTFVGEYLQTPPMYSALKKDGKKLVDLARQGITVPRQARSVTIRSIRVETVEEAAGLYKLTLDCSKGTYVRTLCADIGRLLSCGGAMGSLRRTRSGRFDIGQARTLSQIEEASPEERVSFLLPTEELFADLPAVTLSPFFSKLAASGCPVYLKKLGVSLPAGTRVRLRDQQRFFALAEVRDSEEGPALKALKQFYLYNREEEDPC